jgi:hypothetical protein
MVLGLLLNCSWSILGLLNSEDEGATILRNVCNYLPEDCPAIPLWKPQIFSNAEGWREAGLLSTWWVKLSRFLDSYNDGKCPKHSLLTTETRMKHKKNYIHSSANETKFSTWDKAPKIVRQIHFPTRSANWAQRADLLNFMAFPSVKINVLNAVTNYGAIIRNKLRHSMEQRHFWEANSFSASQKIPRILWKLKVRYRTHNSPPLVSILSQINPVHAPILSLKDLF